MTTYTVTVILAWYLSKFEIVNWNGRNYLLDREELPLKSCGGGNEFKCYPQNEILYGTLWATFKLFSPGVVTFI